MPEIGHSIFEGFAVITNQLIIKKNDITEKYSDLCSMFFESTFRTLKTNLDLRSIYHKTDDASQAHLHLGLLAYRVCKYHRLSTGRTWNNLCLAGIGACDECPKCVTATMINDKDEHISVYVK